MDSFRAQQDVDATADTVWAVLVDGAHYGSWVPGVTDVEGDVAHGQTIRLIGEEGRDASLKVTASPNRRFLRWDDDAPLGMYSDRRDFEIAETEWGCTVVVTRELSGPLEGLLGRAEEDPQTATEDLALSLRKEAESRATNPRPRPAAVTEEERIPGEPPRD